MSRSKSLTSGPPFSSKLRARAFRAGAQRQLRIGQRYRDCAVAELQAAAQRNGAGQRPVGEAGAARRTVQRKRHAGSVHTRDGGRAQRRGQSIGSRDQRHRREACGVEQHAKEREPAARLLRCSMCQRQLGPIRGAQSARRRPSAGDRRGAHGDGE